MKYAVLGSAGQLGRDICARLPGEVFPLTRQDADLTRPETVRACLTRLQPQVVINCAAYNLVDRAETEPNEALAANTWGVETLAQICQEIDGLLVHFSTDFVFGLEKNRTVPYSETEAPGPVNLYGLSKLAGEFLARARCCRHLVIRTCGLFGVWGSGGKGGNFVETMLRLASQGKPIRVVADQCCTPSYTADMAQISLELIRSGQQGLFHLVNSGCCSWHEFAREIFRQSGREANLTAITSQEFGAAAQRPRYSVLSTQALEKVGLPRPRPWQEALAAYLRERQDRDRQSRADSNNS